MKSERLWDVSGHADHWGPPDMLAILPILLLVYYLVRGLPPAVFLRSIGPLCVGLLGFLALWAMLNFSKGSSSFDHWPDSAQYELVSRRILAQIESQSLSFSSLVQVSESYQFLYPLMIALGTYTWFDEPMSMLFLMNVLTVAGVYFASLDLLADGVPDQRIGTGKFLAVISLGTSLGFWSLFLLKDSLATLILVSAFVAYRRGHFTFFALLMLAMCTLRSYLVPLCMIAVGGDLLLLRRFSPRNIVLVALLMLPVLYFSPRQVWSAAEHYQNRQREWVSNSDGAFADSSEEGYSKLLLTLKFLTTPIFPEDGLELSMYSYAFWKLGIVALVFRAVQSRRYRRYFWESRMRPAFVFCVLLTLLYSLFPRFANFRHRLPIEPLVAVAVYVAIDPRCLGSRNASLTQARSRTWTPIARTADLKGIV